MNEFSLCIAIMISFLIPFFYIYRTSKRDGTDNLKHFTTYLGRLTGLTGLLQLSKDWYVLDIYRYNIYLICTFRLLWTSGTLDHCLLLLFFAGARRSKAPSSDFRIWKGIPACCHSPEDYRECELTWDLILLKYKSLFVSSYLIRVYCV
jgi:hypothetical protein